MNFGPFWSQLFPDAWNPAYISAPPWRTEKFLCSRQSFGSHHLNELLSQPSSMFVAREIKQKQWHIFHGHPVLKTFETKTTKILSLEQRMDSG